MANKALHVDRKGRGLIACFPCEISVVVAKDVCPLAASELKRYVFRIIDGEIR
jgi:hypothetical protein